MATTTTSRASTGFPTHLGDSGALSVAYGAYTFTANPSIGDIIQLCKVPANSVIVGGSFGAGDIDSNGTATFAVKVGTAADDDLLGDLGVLNGTVVANYNNTAGTIVPLAGLLATTGPQLVTSETTIQVKVAAAAATFASSASTIWVAVIYSKYTTAAVTT